MMTFVFVRTPESSVWTGEEALPSTKLATYSLERRDKDLPTVPPRPFLIGWVATSLSRRRETQIYIYIKSVILLLMKTSVSVIKGLGEVLTRVRLRFHKKEIWKDVNCFTPSCEPSSASLSCGFGSRLDLLTNFEDSCW